MAEYDEFRKNLIKFLRMELKEMEVSVRAVRKNNGVEKEGLSISGGEKVFTPILYVQDLYQYYQKTKNMEEIAGMIENLIHDDREIRREDLMGAWEECRQRISMRLINEEWNREYLETVPHIDILDLSVVFYLIVQETGREILSLPVLNEMMDCWDVSLDELFKAGMGNMVNQEQVCIFDLKTAISDVLGVEIKEEIPDDGLYILSNKRYCHGAVGILHKDVLLEFAEKMERNLYILPSSVHELVIITDAENISPDYLKNMVESINESHVLPEERLSNSVYYFKRETGEVEKL